MRCKLAAKPGQIEHRIDCSHQMILRNRVAELKLVEKLTLFALQPPHHGLPPPKIASARRNHGSPHASTDFCNKIRQKRSIPGTSAFGPKPEITVASLKIEHSTG
jgi:hypothetical protein